MNYLSLENVSKSFGEKILFNNITLNIARSRKIALIAKNGTGKTSLLKLIAGEESPEGENAKIHLNKDIRLGYLPQEPELDSSHTALTAALDSDNEKIQAIKLLEQANLSGDSKKVQDAIERIEDLKAWDIENKVKEILGRLNIHELDQKVEFMSGGQKKRLALARLLIDEPEFIILDEPTNHLDIDMIEWLEDYLSNPNLTVFMVTHDRYFLERVCNEILELEGGKLYTYKGNYSDYLEKKSARDANEAVQHSKDIKLFKKELEWIRRQPKARGTKAKARVDKFDEIEASAKQNFSNDEMYIEIDMHRLGSKILELHNISKSYTSGKIIDSFSYKFKKGERLGLAGPNGSGKTTLIRLFTKNIAPDTGKVIVGETVKFGYYTQDNDDLREDWKVIDAIRDIAEYIPLRKGRKLTAEALLERFLFPRSQQQVYISKLSGGEKRRLSLLRVLMANPNFLILDEPTNDLDVISLNVLEEFLLSYKGCLLITSHDRYFMDKLVDHCFILCGDGKIKDHNGSYSEYLRNNRKENTQSIKTTSVSEESQKQDQPKRKLSYSEKMEIQKLEDQIQYYEIEKTKLESRFTEPQLDSQEIQKLSIRIAEIESKLSECEDRWLELSELL